MVIRSAAPWKNGKWEKPRSEVWDIGVRDQIWNNSRIESWNPIPPWQQQQQDMRTQNFWQDTIERRPANGQGQWIDYKEQYQRSSFADFDRVGGPVRQNKFNKRTRPY